MNGSSDDLLRSLRRFVGLALGSPPWTVRTERQPVADDDRPVAVIEPASAVATLSARTTIPQGDVRKQQTLSVVAYPVIGGVARSSRVSAQEAADALDAAFTNGLVDSVSGASIGGPLRVPVFDFAGVPVEGAARAGPAVAYMHAWVEDLLTRPIQDPIDPLRFTVTCDVRLSWWQGGRVGPAAPKVARWGGVWAAPGQPVVPPLSAP